MWIEAYRLLSIGKKPDMPFNTAYTAIPSLTHVTALYLYAFSEIYYKMDKQLAKNKNMSGPKKQTIGTITKWAIDWETKTEVSVLTHNKICILS